MDEKRLAGVVLPLFSLRRNNDHGIGDLTALRQWIDWAADAHVGFLQLLPVNALGRDECPSPYSAISSVALEPLYLSLEPWTIPGLEERVFNETGDTLPWEQPSGPDLVDYPKVRFWKMWILRGAWNNFKTKPEYECIMPKFREWVKEQGSWLEDFVCFRFSVTCSARKSGGTGRNRIRRGPRPLPPITRKKRILPAGFSGFRKTVGIHPYLWTNAM